MENPIIDSLIIAWNHPQRIRTRVVTVKCYFYCGNVAFYPQWKLMRIRLSFSMDFLPPVPIFCGRLGGGIWEPHRFRSCVCFAATAPFCLLNAFYWRLTRIHYLVCRGEKNPPRVIKTLVWTAIILKFSPFRCRQLLNVHEILLKQDFLIYPGRPLPSLSPRGTLSSATKKVEKIPCIVHSSK